MESSELVTRLHEASRWMRHRGWHRLLAKLSDYTQSLFHHTLVELNLLVAMQPLLCDQSGFGLTDDQFLRLFVANLCHDAGKENPDWQMALRRGEKPPDHVHYKETAETAREWAQRLGRSDREFVPTVMAAVGLHHKATQGPASTLDQLLHGGQTDTRWRELADVVEAVDKICSAGNVWEAAREADRRFGRGLPQPRFAVTFHRLQVLRGVSSTFIHRASQEAHVEAGWIPSLHFADGTLYLALAAVNTPLQLLEEIRQKLASLLNRLLQEANLPEQVVGNPTGDMLPKPELFSAQAFADYLKVAGSRSKALNFRKKHRKSDGTFSQEFLKNVEKYHNLRFQKWLMERYATLESLAQAWELNPGCVQTWGDVNATDCSRRHDDETSFQKEFPHTRDPDRALQRFLISVPLDGMFRFFKAVILGGKLLSQKEWPLPPEPVKLVEKPVENVKDKAGKLAVKESPPPKNSRKTKDERPTEVKCLYEKEFGQGSFDDLASVTNDPAINLAKAVDYFLEQEVPGEHVKWASKPTDIQKAELIRRLSGVFQTAIEKLPAGLLPLHLGGEWLAEVFLGDLALGARVAPVDGSKHLEAYLGAKEGKGKDSFCPWSNEPGHNVTGTGADLGVATDGHSNRLPMQDKTWKNRGGVAMATASRYELMLRRMILGTPSEQMIVLLPPAQLGPLEGGWLVEAVAELEQKVSLFSREYTPNPSRRFSFALTDQIAQRWKANEGAPLSELLNYTSAPETSKGQRNNLDKQLREAFGPYEEGDQLKTFNETHGRAFKSWSEAREHKTLGKEAEAVFLGDAVAALNEECETAFGSWEEAVEAIYSGHSDDARRVLASSEEVRERRRSALQLREPGRFICQTPNLIFFLLPDRISVGRDSDANGAIRQLFLSLVLAHALGISVATVDREEALTFSGGEGVVLLPRNAALRAQVGRVRKSQAAMGVPVCVAGAHDWLQPDEAESWLSALSAVHYLARRPGLQGKVISLFPESSSLYGVLSARSAGFLVKRIEDKTKRTVFRDEMQNVGLLERFLG